VRSTTLSYNKCKAAQAFQWQGTSSIQLVLQLAVEGNCARTASQLARLKVAVRSLFCIIPALLAHWPQ